MTLVARRALAAHYRTASVCVRTSDVGLAAAALAGTGVLVGSVVGFLGCRLSEEAGAHYVKTSTGFAGAGAAAEDIALMRATVSPHVGVKAAGGVRTLGRLLELAALGATRFGATATAAILDDLDARRSDGAVHVGSDS